MKKVNIQDIEEIKNILELVGVETKNLGKEIGFDRYLFFEIYGIKYKITWFVNQVTLEILTGGDRNPQIPFSRIGIDTTAPIAPRDNKSLIFYTFEKEGFITSPIYESFRIPLEI